MKSHPLRCDWMASMTNGHEFEQALGVGDGQGSLVCCSPWGCKEWGTNKRLNCIDYHGDNLEKKMFFNISIYHMLCAFRVSLVAQMVQNPPAIHDTCI